MTEVLELREIRKPLSEILNEEAKPRLEGLLLLRGMKIVLFVVV
jgi:hypothetical protein